MAEYWKPIGSISGYEISSEGRVRAVTRTIKQTQWSGTEYSRSFKPREMAVYICKRTGYAQITLGNRKRALVHRLVADAFIPNPEAKPQVNHKNGQRADNRVENLEWSTCSENVKHAYDELSRLANCQGKFSGEHPTSKAVISTDLLTGFETRYESAMDAVREGFESSCISRCCAGKSKYHRGRTWVMAEDASQEVA
jgi:hypothetical protein